MKVIKKVLGEKVYNKIWKRSHDAIERIQTLGDLYGNVPEKLKNKRVYVTELHQFEEKDKKEILNWLDETETPKLQESDSKSKNTVVGYNLVLKCALATYYENIFMIYDRGKHKEYDENIKAILKTIKELQDKYGKPTDKEKEDGWIGA